MRGLLIACVLVWGVGCSKGSHYCLAQETADNLMTVRIVVTCFDDWQQCHDRDKQLKELKMSAAACSDVTGVDVPIDTDIPLYIDKDLLSDND